MAWISRSCWLFYRQLTVELHERWLAELHSESMKHKLALAEGKITNEEYMENINKEIDLSTLSIQDVYALRSQAQQKGDTELLGKISIFLNGRSGGFGETLESLLAKRQQMKDDLTSGKISDVEYKKFLDELHLANNCPIRNNFNQRYGATGRERQFIEASKLIQGDEKVLALVPHRGSAELNANSIRFWDLQDIILNAGYQEDPDSADLKDPTYTLMDPTFEELRDPSGLTQHEMKKADVVLSLNSYGQWVVMKTPHQELDNRYLWILKVPEVKLDELFVSNPKEIWVYVDHRLGYTNDCENVYHAFAEHLAKIKPDVILHLMSGHPTAEWMREQEIVLMADRFGFFVKHAPQTPHIAKVVPLNELVGPYSKIHQHLYFSHSTLTSQCRAEFSREVKPLSPDNDPGQFYTNEIKPMEPSPDKVWSPVDPDTKMNRE